MSLVEEIQAGALDRTVSVADLLRRVKLAAAKLKLADTLEWVERELNGYTDEIEDMPSYRIARGALMGHSPYHGTRQAHGDPRTIAMMSMTCFHEPIGSLEVLLTSPNAQIVMPVDAKLAEGVKRAGVPDNYSIYFSKNVIVGIVDTVRNMVLDWSINLEAEGIFGEGVSFTMEEKSKAVEAAPSINITNYGHLHQGDTHGHQNRTNVGSVDSSSNSLTIDVFKQLQSAVNNNIDNAADRGALLALIKQMEAKKGSSGFKDIYTKFLVAAGHHMTVLAPFLPALSAYLPG